VIENRKSYVFHHSVFCINFHILLIIFAMNFHVEFKIRKNDNNKHQQRKKKTMSKAQKAEHQTKYDNDTKNSKKKNGKRKISKEKTKNHE